MKPTMVDCDLMELRQRSDSNMGAEFVLKNKETEEEIVIQVDESLERVKSRFKDQLSGEDERDGIYLSRGMRNINISLTGMDKDKFDLNQEDWNWYVFSKENVESLLK